MEEQTIDPLGIVSAHRGIILSPGHNCNFAGTITLGGPSSLSESDTYYSIGRKQREAFHLVIDHVNSRRCGVNLRGERYAMKLEMYGDRSSVEWTESIGRHLTDSDNGSNDDDGVDVLIGGYSSDLTEVLARIANAAGILLLAPGASDPSVFAGRETVFSSHPPSEMYASAAMFDVLASRGAKTVVSVWEDASFTRGVCSALPVLADMHGIELISATEVADNPTVEDLEVVALGLKAQDPDVVVTCVYDQGCANWIEATKKADWSPRAQVFTVCVGLQGFVDAVGGDSEYMMGITPWTPMLDVVDNVTGWSAREFAQKYKLATGDVDVPYQAASSASMISIAVQAIERAGSLNTTALAKELAGGMFETMYGNINFDQNGQGSQPTLLIQYDGSGTVQTVFPREAASEDMLYPIPTWAERACLKGYGCIPDGNSCSPDGVCICASADEYAVGIRATASCTKQSTNITGKIVGIVISIIITFIALLIGWHKRGDIMASRLQNSSEQRHHHSDSNNEEVESAVALNRDIRVGESTTGAFDHGDHDNNDYSSRQDHHELKNEHGTNRSSQGLSSRGVNSPMGPPNETVTSLPHDATDEDLNHHHQSTTAARNAENDAQHAAGAEEMHMSAHIVPGEQAENAVLLRRSHTRDHSDVSGNEALSHDGPAARTSFNLGDNTTIHIHHNYNPAPNSSRQNSTAVDDDGSNCSNRTDSTVDRLNLAFLLLDMKVGNIDPVDAVKQLIQAEMQSGEGKQDDTQHATDPGCVQPTENDILFVGGGIIDTNDGYRMFNQEIEKFCSAYNTEMKGGLPSLVIESLNNKGCQFFELYFDKQGQPLWTKMSDTDRMARKAFEGRLRKIRRSKDRRLDKYQVESIRVENLENKASEQEDAPFGLLCQQSDTTEVSKAVHTARNQEEGAAQDVGEIPCKDISSNEHRTELSLRTYPSGQEIEGDAEE